MSVPNPLDVTKDDFIALVMSTYNSLDADDIGELYDDVLLDFIESALGTNTTSGFLWKIKDIIKYLHKKKEIASKFKTDPEFKQFLIQPDASFPAPPDYHAADRPALAAWLQYYCKDSSSRTTQSYWGVANDTVRKMTEKALQSLRNSGPTKKKAESKSASKTAEEVIAPAEQTCAELMAARQAEVPNLFAAPGAHNLNTVEGLNAFIGATFAANLGDEAVNTPSKGTIEDQFSDDFCPVHEDQVGGNVNNMYGAWQRMYASGNNYDCLIHAFLTATCPNFRRLDTATKDPIATSFRIRLFPTFPTVLPMIHAGRKECKQIFTPDTFLYDMHVDALFHHYRIGYILFDLGRAARQGRLGYVQQPPTVIHKNEHEQPNVYMLFNNGGHYEAVRRSEQGEGYLLPDDDAVVCQAFGDMIRDARAPATRREPCFEEGTQVVFNGTEYIVFQRKYNEEQNAAGHILRCNQYKLSTPAQWAQWTALPKATRDSAKDAQKAPFISVTVGRADIAAGRVHLPGAEIPAAGNGAAAARANGNAPAAAAAVAKANVTVNSRNNYIQKRLNDPENGGMLIEAGVGKADLEQQFGEAWNAAHKGGAHRRRRNTRRKQRTTRRRKHRTTHRKA